MNDPSFREECARLLRQAEPAVASLRAFIGLDGFVDQIIHAVDKRHNPKDWTRLPTMRSFADRIAEAAGKSTNIELVTVKTKIGGNGPIMANALVNLGLKVTYIGTVGSPGIHPVFQEFASRAEVSSIAEPSLTDAVEFLDGKVMLGKHASLGQVTWENIQKHFGRDRFVTHFQEADLVGFMNWTMLPFMTQIWESLLSEICPGLKGKRRRIFFDLADPEKRSAEDIVRALQRISEFQKYFDVILGLNEREATEVAEVLGIEKKESTPEGLAATSLSIYEKLKVDTLVVHPVTYALAVTAGKVDVVNGPVITHPVITTGAGDHFNSGFCLAKLLGLNNAQAVLCGVATSGFYVKTGQSPSIADLAGLMNDWPDK